MSVPRLTSVNKSDSQTQWKFCNSRYIHQYMMAIMDISVAVIQVYSPRKLFCCHWQMIVKQENVSSSQLLVEFVLLNLKFSV